MPEVSVCYKIYPVFLGSIQSDKSRSLHQYPAGEPIRTSYTCFVLKGNGKTIMVDTGLPTQDDIKSNNKPFRIMQDAPDLKDALAKIGIDPLDVTDIILTHLHYDHSCNIDLFPNAAKIYVQQREIRHALDPLPAEYRIYSLQKECGTPEWVKGLGRFELVDGDVDLMPGIRVLLTPGHSPGSQSVVVDTQNGIYVLTGDYIPIMDSFTKRIPNAILNSIDDWYASYDKIAALDATLLPGHDSTVHDTKVYG